MTYLYGLLVPLQYELRASIGTVIGNLFSLNKQTKRYNSPSVTRIKRQVFDVQLHLCESYPTEMNSHYAPRRKSKHSTCKTPKNTPKKT